MKRSAVLVLILLFFASACIYGQEAGGPVILNTPAPSIKKPLAQGSITGHVICSDTHAPARGAHIMIMPFSALGVAEGEDASNNQPHMAITALDGSFFVPHISPGEYVVMPFATGYLSPVDGMMVSGNGTGTDRKAITDLLREKASIVRVNGQEAARIDIELQRGAILSGKVIYSDGSPAAQLPVLLQNSDRKKDDSKSKDVIDVGVAMRGMLLRQSPNTDDQGHFRISGIAAGSYRLAVTQMFEGGTDFGGELMSVLNPAKQTGKLTIYSGNTLHQKDAKLYKLRPGDSVDGIEIILPLNGLHSIKGIAAGKDGTPLNFGVLSLSDTADSAINFHANIQAGGEFRFSGIPEGTYEIKVTNGRIFENPPAFEFPEEQLVAMQQQFKPSRAFADTTVAVIVQTTDIDGLTLTLADTKLPDPPAPGPELPTVVQPQ